MCNESHGVHLQGPPHYSDAIQLEQQARELRAALDKAERDTKRLDWVLQYGARWTDDGTSSDRPGHWYTIEWDFGGVAEGLGLRAAVDAGIAKHEAQYGTGTHAVHPIPDDFGAKELADNSTAYGIQDEAYTSGCKAADTGAEIRSNPYVPAQEPAKWLAWRRGWQRSRERRSGEYVEFWTSDCNPADFLAVQRMLAALNIDPQLDANYSHWILLAKPGTKESYGSAAVHPIPDSESVL